MIKLRFFIKSISSFLNKENKIEEVIFKNIVVDVRFRVPSCHKLNKNFFNNWSVCFSIPIILQLLLVNCYLIVCNYLPRVRLLV